MLRSCRCVAALLALLLVPLAIWAQTPKEVEIIHAGAMRPITTADQEAIRLLDSVILGHGLARMRCDSAYLYSATNAFDAYGRVHIDNQGITIDGDSLYYDGNTGLGRITGHLVTLHDSARDATLWSDIVFFNSQTNVSHYLTGGTIRSGANNLKSLRGYYYSDLDMAAVAGRVVFKGEKIDAYGDTIQYYQQSQQLYFWQPTRLYKQHQMLYATEGWYSQLQDEGELHQDAMLDNGDKRLFADWLYTDNAQGFYEAKGRATIEDSLSTTRLYAQRIRYWREQARGIADDNPLLFAVDTAAATRDTLFLRAQQIRYWAVPDSTSPTDTIRYLKAIDSVRVYRPDMQAVADTLYFDGQDSTIHLFRNPYPYVWKQELQARARYMVGYLGPDQLDSVYLYDRVLVASQDDSTHYHQIAGDHLKGYFRESALETVKVNGNGQVLFFMRDQGQLIAVNQVQSPCFLVHIVNNEPSDVIFYQGPSSKIVPIQDTEREDRELPGFQWRDDLRPHAPHELIPNWIENLEYYVPLRERAHAYRRLERSPGVDDSLLQAAPE